MPKHVIIRTSIYHDASDYRSNVSELINHLDKGWKIISYASVGETRVEYVLQSPESNLCSSCKKLKEHGG